MTSNRKLDQSTAQELILDTDFHTHSSDDQNISSSQKDENEEEDITDTDNTYWTDSILSTSCTCSSHITWNPFVLWQNKAPHITTHSTSLSILMYFFLKIIHLLVEETKILSPTLGHTSKRTLIVPDIIIHEVYFTYLRLCRWNIMRGTYWKTNGPHDSNLHGLLQIQNETWQILSDNWDFRSWVT